jgi:hypothetical protein
LARTLHEKKCRDIVFLSDPWPPDEDNSGPTARGIAIAIERGGTAMVDGTKHSMTETLKGQTPENAAASGQPGHPQESGRPRSTHDEVAEEARRQQESRSHGRPDREDHLVNVGRGQQTHG